MSELPPLPPLAIRPQRSPNTRLLIGTRANVAGVGEITSLTELIAGAPPLTAALDGSETLLVLKDQTVVAAPVGAFGGGGGIPEAPADGEIYGRRDARWDQIAQTQGGGIPEAPATPTLHARRGSDQSWQPIPPDDTRLAKTGDTMTGDLTLSTPANGVAEVRFTASEGGDVTRIRFRAALDGRPLETAWLLESGPDWFVRRYVENLAVDEPFALKRDGSVLLQRPRTSSGDPRGDDDLVRKAYADASVRKQGDTMTGGLTISNGGLVVTVPGLEAWVRLQGETASLFTLRNTAGDVRWGMGSWFGSGTPYQNAFAIAKLEVDLTTPDVDVVFRIDHASGTVGGHRFAVDAGDPLDADDLARKAYVDRIVAVLETRVAELETRLAAAQARTGTRRRDTPSPPE